MGDQTSNIPFKSKHSHSPGQSKEAPEDFLLFFCKPSRPMSSPHPYYPQSSCCWSGEEFVWSQCRCTYSYSLWNALTKQPWTVHLQLGWGGHFCSYCVISQKLHVLAELAPALSLLLPVPLLVELHLCFSKSPRHCTCFIVKSCSEQVCEDWHE